MTRWSKVLTAQDYVAGLSALAPRISAAQRRLLVEQYRAPDRRVTAPQLAELAGIAGGYTIVNYLYGRLGRMFCNQTGHTPDVRPDGPNKGKERLWATWSAGERVPDGFVWQMLPEVAEALEQLGWVSNEPEAETPSAEQYVAAFRTVSGLVDSHYQLLRTHYQAPHKTITAKQLAELVGYNHYSLANAQYGKLARLVGEKLDYQPRAERLATLVRFEKRHGEWHWIMRSEVSRALEMLGWVEGTGILLPEEINAVAETFTEGAVLRVLVNAYERDPDARRRCIAEHGASCCICGFNFAATYGPVADGFTHVHHLRPLSEVGQSHQVDPVKDLRPVCPNCHAVLHRRVPAYSIEEVKTFLEQQKQQTR